MTVELSTGEEVTCTFTNTKRGSITVIKNSVPNDEQNFDFVFEGNGALDPFTLDDDAGFKGKGVNDFSDTITFSNLVPGGYSVTESPIAAWGIQSLSCPSNLDSSAVIACGTAQIQLSAGDHVTCTFVNTTLGTVIIDKTAVGGDGTFNFTGGGEIPANFNLTTVDGMPASVTYGGLFPGDYSVSEVGQPAGWDLTGSSFSAGTPAGFTLEPGSTVTCDFENTKRGHVVIIKEVNSANPASLTLLFSFSPSYGSPFALIHRGDNDQELVPGRYTVSEDVPAGWDLTLVCEDPDGGTSVSGPMATIDLDAGEIVTCTFENTERGEIIIDKVTVPSDSSQEFQFSLKNGPSALNEPFMLTNGMPAYHSGLILPGAGYLATQDVPDGWDPSVVSCTSSFNQSTYEDTITSESMSAEIYLAPGDTMTCVFNNTERGQIIINKVTHPALDAQSFDFSLTQGVDTVISAFALGDVGIEPSGFLLPTKDVPSVAPYVISETARADWDLVSLVCTAKGERETSDTFSTALIDLEAGTATIDLAAGESVTCVFTNTKRGNILVVKELDGLYPSNPSLTGFSYTLKGPNSLDAPFTINLSSPWYDVAADHGLLPSGDTFSYSISELVPAGWTLTYSGCDGDIPVNKITVPPGETITCTFTNKMQLHAGSSGFWKNQRYGDIVFSDMITAAIAGSAVYEQLFTVDGDLVGNAIAVVDAALADPKRTEDEKILKQYTAVLLNLAVSKNPEFAEYQDNDNICRECTLNLDELPGAEDLIRRLSPNLIIGEVTIGDLIDAVEYAWAGPLVDANGDPSQGTWTFDAPVLPGDVSLGSITEDQAYLLSHALEGITQGWYLNPDPDSYNNPDAYPDGPTCLVAGLLPDGIVGEAYGPYQLGISGGTAPYTWRLTAGTLPIGLELTSDGTVLGTPLDSGHYSFTAMVTDSFGATASAQFQITIRLPLEVNAAAGPLVGQVDQYLE